MTAVPDDRVRALAWKFLVTAPVATAFVAVEIAASQLTPLCSSAVTTHAAELAPLTLKSTEVFAVIDPLRAMEPPMETALSSAKLAVAPPATFAPSIFAIRSDPTLNDLPLVLAASVKLDVTVAAALTLPPAADSRLHLFSISAFAKTLVEADPASVVTC
jgi:hypothetical protein